ncbi:MAG: prolipoprotein diacylglyceryl transferase [Bacteroidetes bacterium]|jgi:phosphatidylglycerol:prolipoprotein diacylglycerol transferase|nr:prolipoprotein diacylglyceryl transferase [Bacteroidota bacterium]
MIPVLFQIGPLKVYSYGLMLGIGFLLGSFILARELKRKKLDPNMASTVTVLAVIFGIAGAKILFLIEDWNHFVKDPIGMAFSPGGLTWYGGFILGLAAVITYVRRKKVPVLRFLDALGVALILAYGVARLGCHLSGDGDYGFPTDLPWGTNYENGTYPPSRAFAIFPEITSQYPGGLVPDSTPCHPTPVYELLLGTLGFAILWRLRKKPYPDGKLFMIYLMLSSTFRFLVEFLRLNPRIIFGLSEAQVISIPLFLAGLLIMLYLDRKQRATKAQPAGR